jgi:hypothetical protein
MPSSDAASNYREAMSQHEKCIRDLAHEVILARDGGTVPPSVFAALSNAAVDCAEMLDHYRGQRVPSELQSAVANLQRAIGTLRGRSTDRRSSVQHAGRHGGA